MAKRKSEGHARKKAELQSKKESEVEQAKKQRLSEFTPRELMEELKRRGYDGELVYTEVKRINLSKL
jgi:exosome complex RNA-binding protein Csl4